VRQETFEQLMNVGAGRQLSISKAANAKRRNAVRNCRVTVCILRKVQKID